MTIPLARKSSHVALVLSLLVSACLCPVLGATVDRGWKQYPLAAHGVFYERFVPDTADLSSPQPVIVFLHGSGGMPANYHASLTPPAEDLDAVLLMPKSSSDLGWGFGSDRDIVFDSIDEVRQELRVDEERISIAGHSSGGGYAYLMAYLDDASPYSGVFSMGAPYLPVPHLAQSSYVPPIRMYYGEDDPNFKSARDPLASQWDALEVPFEEEVRMGFGHSTWPQSTILAGFQFLLAQQRVAQAASTCVTSDTELCLRDGGFKVTVDWEDFEGKTGQGFVSSLRTDDSGIFYFFDRNNWEVLVKVIDGCAVTQHQWVFLAASTNIQYTLTVEELATGRVATYTNPLGEASAAVTDTGAFSCSDPETP